MDYFDETSYEYQDYSIDVNPLAVLKIVNGKNSRAADNGHS
jgi:hypothetical protein